MRRVPQASKRVSRIETLPTLPEIDHPSSRTLAILTIPRLVLPFSAARRERPVDLVPFAEVRVLWKPGAGASGSLSFLTYVSGYQINSPQAVRCFQANPIEEPDGLRQYRYHLLCSGTARAVRCFNLVLPFVAARREPSGVLIWILSKNRAARAGSADIPCISLDAPLTLHACRPTRRQRFHFGQLRHRDVACESCQQRAVSPAESQGLLRRLTS